MSPLIPAKAGTQIVWLLGRGQGALQTSKPQRPMIWVPAFAGMSG